MGRFPAHLSFGETAIVRLPRSEIDGARFDDGVENRRDAPRVPPRKPVAVKRKTADADADADADAAVEPA